MKRPRKNPRPIEGKLSAVVPGESCRGSDNRLRSRIDIHRCRSGVSVVSWCDVAWGRSVVNRFDINRTGTNRSVSAKAY